MFEDKTQNQPLCFAGKVFYSSNSTGLYWVAKFSVTNIIKIVKAIKGIMPDCHSNIRIICAKDSSNTDREVDKLLTWDKLNLGFNY